MKIFALTALAVCAATPQLDADEWLRPAGLRQGVVYAEPIFGSTTMDFTQAERARRWQAELAVRELEIQRAQTAWLPATPIRPIREDVVRDRPTYSNALFAMNRPHAFVPEPYYEMPNSDRRLIAYQTYSYAPAPYWQPGYPLAPATGYAARVGFPRGPAEVAIQPVTPGPGNSVLEREAAIDIRAASVDTDGRALR